MRYPNQKKITINKMETNSNNPYTIINLNTLQNAMSTLKKAGTFKLWIYLAKNQHNYTFDLSCAECKKWGLKPDTYHSAVKELIELGYLKKTKENEYIFFENI